MDDFDSPRPKALRIATDRNFLVPQGKVVRTCYVDIWKIRLACRDKMAIGDVDAAYRKRLQLGGDQAWPCPYGHWEGDEFIIIDGRHEFVASIMLGLTHLLVAWME